MLGSRTDWRASQLRPPSHSPVLPRQLGRSSIRHSAPAHNSGSLSLSLRRRQRRKSDEKDGETVAHRQEQPEPRSGASTHHAAQGQRRGPDLQGEQVRSASVDEIGQVSSLLTLCPSSHDATCTSVPPSDRPPLAHPAPDTLLRNARAPLSRPPTLVCRCTSTSSTMWPACGGARMDG